MNTYLFTLCAIWLLPALAIAQENPKQKAHRAVFEIVSDSHEAWDAVLNNVESVRKAFGANQTHVVVIAHGNGLGLLHKESLLRERTEMLAGAGVVFSACENTMRKKTPRARTR